MAELRLEFSFADQQVRKSKADIASGFDDGCCFYF